MKELILKYFVKISRKSAELIERAKMTEHSFMVIAAIVIGTLAGLGAILIRLMIHGISDSVYLGSGSLLTRIIASPWYIKILVPAGGGLIVGPLIYFFAKEAKGHGVPEVMQSLIMRGGVIRPRVAIVKAIASAITIGTGGSVGREGPIVQIGSSIGSTIGQFFRVSNVRMKTFVGCGAAAGIAAAFNAPVAGAFFALEILLQNFAFSQFYPIVISSVMATVISHSIDGDFAAFIVPAYQLKNPIELLFYFLLAVICALVGHMFIKILYFSEDFFDDSFKFPEYLKPMIGGALIGAMAIFFPEVMGIGYESITSALKGDQAIWKVAFMLVFIKIIATSVTLGSGGSGGIFAPSLFLGAMTGVFFGGMIHSIFPSITSSSGAYALVAMGGLISATTYAPITAIIIVFELTKDYNIILPLMITCIMSTIISLKLSRESIYTLKLLKRNIFIKDGTEQNVMKSIVVNDVYTKTFETIKSSDQFDEVVNKIISGHDPYFPVLDDKKKLCGVISLHDIKEHLYDKDIFRNLLIADDIANKNIKVAYLDEDCHEVLEKLSQQNLQGLPVVDKRKIDHIKGMIWRKDILDEYNREIERRNITNSFASRITIKNIDTDIHFMEGYAMTEIPVPKSFVGKSIKNLDIRAKFGVDIILIRNNDDKGSMVKAIPSPDYEFSFKDSIVIAGEIKNLNLLKSF